MSQELVAALIEVNAVILHCDRPYRPVGITSGIERVVHSDALFNQGNRTRKNHVTHCTSRRCTGTIITIQKKQSSQNVESGFHKSSQSVCIIHLQHGGVLFRPVIEFFFQKVIVDDVYIAPHPRDVVDAEIRGDLVGFVVPLDKNGG